MKNLENGFGIMNKNSDLYDFYKGKWVDVITQNGQFWGKYQGMEEGYLILRPHIMMESRPSEKSDEMRKCFVIADEPRFITGTFIINLSGLREEYIMAKVNNKEIILPKRD